MTSKMFNIILYKERGGRKIKDREKEIKEREEGQK